MKASKLSAGRMLRLLACTLVVSAGSAHAALVEYTVSSLGGQTWRYDYTLVNSGPAVTFDEFTVYFDTPGVVGMGPATAPLGWDSLVVQPDPQLPDAGYFDSLNLSGTVAPGSTVSGFSVIFTAIAGYTPGAQRFDLVLSDPFETVYSGITSEAVSAVPLPAPLLLLLSGLGLGAAGMRRGGRAGSKPMGEVAA